MPYEDVVGSAPAQEPVGHACRVTSWFVTLPFPVLYNKRDLPSSVTEVYLSLMLLVEISNTHVMELSLMQVVPLVTIKYSSGSGFHAQRV